MTRDELIKKLQEFEENLDVMLYDSEQEFLYGIGEIEKDLNYDKKPPQKVIVIS